MARLADSRVGDVVDTPGDVLSGTRHAKSFCSLLIPSSAMPQ
jgi:hypothetical protein